mgnify:CR=1 FL=1
MLPLHLSDLVLEWYDLDRGVAHLGQGVAQLSQVLSFLAEVIVTLVAEALLLADVTPCRSAFLSSLLDTLCQSFVLSIYHLFGENQPAVATCPG